MSGLAGSGHVLIKQNRNFGCYLLVVAVIVIDYATTDCDCRQVSEQLIYMWNENGGNATDNSSRLSQTPISCVVTPTCIITNYIVL